MNFTLDDINKIAHLARINLQPAESERFVHDVNETMALISKIQTVDTTHITAMAHPLGHTQRLRADVVTEHDEHQKFQVIAPRVEANLYLVPKVIE